MDEVRTCVVGMGIGRANGRAIYNNPRGRVTAVCDIIEWKMHDYAKELPEEVKYYIDYKEMCQDPDIDAVMVATPNQVHVPVAMEAIKNGKHVLCTKPLAHAAEPARELVAVAEASGLVNMMSLGMRFSDQVLYMGDLIQQGELGEIYYARARSMRRSGIPDWNVDFIKEGGGGFRDMGVHVLDVAWWLLGMPKPVSVTGVAGAKFGPHGEGYWNFRQAPDEYWEQYDADDFGGGFIRFDNGVGMQVESFWAGHHGHKFETQVDLFGTEAGAQLRPLTIYKTVHGMPQDIAVKPPEGPKGFGRVANHFIDCILDGVECQAPLRHGLIVQEMLEALLKSGLTGEEIRFD